MYFFVFYRTLKCKKTRKKVILNLNFFDAINDNLLELVIRLRKFRPVGQFNTVIVWVNIVVIFVMTRNMTKATTKFLDGVGYKYISI